MEYEDKDLIRLGRLFRLSEFNALDNETSFEDAVAEITSYLEFLQFPTTNTKLDNEALIFLKQQAKFTDVLCDALEDAEGVANEYFPGFGGIGGMGLRSIVMAMLTLGRAQAAIDGGDTGGNRNENECSRSSAEGMNDDGEKGSGGESLRDKESGESQSLGGSNDTDGDQHEDGGEADGGNPGSGDEGEEEVDESEASKVLFVNQPTIPLISGEATYSQLTRPDKTPSTFSLFHGSDQTGRIDSFEANGVFATAGNSFYDNNSSTYYTTASAYAIWYGVRCRIVEEVKTTVAEGRLEAQVGRTARNAQVRDVISDDLRIYPVVVVEVRWTREDWWGVEGGTKWSLNDERDEAKFIAANMDRSNRRPITPPGAPHSRFDIIIGRREGESLKATDMDIVHRELIGSDPAFVACRSRKSQNSFADRTAKIWALNISDLDREAYKSSKELE